MASLNNEAIELMKSGRLVDGLLRLNLATAQTAAVLDLLNMASENNCDDQKSASCSENDSQSCSSPSQQHLNLANTLENERLRLIPQWCEKDEVVLSSTGPEITKCSLEPIIGYDKFLSIQGTPRLNVKEDQHLVSAVAFYNIATASYRRAKTSSLSCQHALHFYQLAAAAGNQARILQYGNGNVMVLPLAILANMACIYADTWEPLKLHFCLRESHTILKNPCYTALLHPQEVSFFLSNLTCACIVQWNLAPAA